MKEDDYYPFKKDDGIEIITPKNDYGCFVEFKSTRKDDSIKLMFSLNEKLNYSCYSSEV